MKRFSFRTWLWLIPAFGLTTLPCFAPSGSGSGSGTDSDNDGMSDLWELVHGFSTTDDGTLYPDEAPGADADGDGRTNLKEAEAGTDPRSGTPPDGYLATNVVLNESPLRYSVGFQSVAGKLYQLEFSPDLETWADFDDPTVGDGGPVTFEILADDFEEEPRYFWRVRVGDIDEDGDGLTSADEAIIESDPNDYDENNNDIRDGWEWSHFLTLGIDPGADPDDDGFTNLQEFWADTNPLDDDTDNDGAEDGVDADPLTAGAQLTSFKVTQQVPGASDYDPALRLPGRDTYVMTPDRTGLVTITPTIEHTYAGGNPIIKLIDGDGVVIHTFPSSGSSFSVPSIKFNKLLHVVVYDPTGTAVIDNNTIVTGGGGYQDGPGFIGGPSGSTFGIPSLVSAEISEGKDGEGDAGEDYGSCKTCSSSCDLTNGNDTGDVTGEGLNGGFSLGQPAGTSANGDSQTQFNAQVNPTAGIAQENMQVHGNGDASITRDAGNNNRITSVTTDSTYTKVESITVDDKSAVRLSQWKSQEQAEDEDPPAPFRVVTYINSGTNEITRTNVFNGGSPVTSVWNYDSSAKEWTFVEAGLRKKVLRLEGDLADSLKRLERHELYEKNTAGSWVLVSDVRKTFTKFVTGWKKTKIEVFGLADNPLVTEWKYWGGNELPGDNANGNSLLKKVTYPDGKVVIHEYERQSAGTDPTYTHGMTSQFLGGESSVFTEVSTTASGNSTSTQSSEVTDTGASVFSQSSTSWSGNTATTQHYSGPSVFEESTTTVAGFGSDFGGKPTASILADGTASETSYTRGSDDSTTTSVFGEVDGSGIIVDGTEESATTNRDGVVVLRSKHDVASNVTTNSSRVPTGETDSIGRPRKIEHLDGNGDPMYWEKATYACCGLSSVTDKYGVVTSYAYDALKRVTRTNSLGVTRHTVYDGLVVHQHRYAGTVSGGLFTGTATSGDEISNSERDLSGTIRYSRSRSPQDGSLITDATTTTILRNPLGPTPNPGSLPSGIGRRVTTVLVSTSDDGVATPSETTDYYLDRRVYQTTGNLSTNVRYSYAVGSYDWDGGGVDGKGTVTTTTVLDGSGNESEKSISYVDYDGVLQAVKTDWSGLAQYFYTDTNLTKTIDADGVTKLYDYRRSQRVLEALDLNGNGEIDYGTDQITYQRPLYIAGPMVQTDVKVWKPGAAEGAPTIISRSERALSGLESSRTAFPTTSNGSGSGYGTVSGSVELGTQEDGDWTETTVGADGVVSRDYYDDGRLVASTLWTAGTTPPDTAPSNITSVSTTGFISGKAYGYDTLGRRTTVTDSRTGTVTTAYYSTVCDAVASVTDAGSRVTANTYDHRARQKTVDLPDTLSATGATLANVTTTSHFIDGAVKLVDGGQAYKTAYTYDYAGRMETLTTYGDSTATTIWNYDSAGRLSSKTYPDGFDSGTAADPGPEYYYTDGGRLKKRIWARGNTTRYDDDSGGRLAHTRYFTAATTQTAVDAATTGNDAATPDSAFIYDALGRIEEAANAYSSIEYEYHSSLLTLATETISIDPDGSGSRSAVTRTIERGRDSLLRPDGNLFKDGSTVEAEVEYTYHASHGRLDQVSGSHGTFGWTYEPESYGLTAAITGPQHVAAYAWKPDRDVLHSRANSERYGDNTLFSSYEYAVNDIAQRTGVTLGGDQFSVTGIAWGYDAIGQVTTADRAGGNTGDRGYKYDGIGNRDRSSRNTTDPDTATGSDLARYINGAGSSDPDGANALNQYGHLIQYGAAGVTQSYDADGNQIAGAYPAGAAGDRTWDGENRMIQTEVGSDTVRYAYDPLGRRVAKFEGSGTGMTGRVCFYDGWNVAAECGIDSSTYPLDRTYTWGPDLSGTMQGAGGVGGLLAVEIETGGDAGVYYPTYDGNGNVSEYLDSLGDIVAHYEYDPFGEEVAATGAKAGLFNYRFSTKPLDTETGYYYYGYRYYDPVTGRWPSRDPIGENGGVNLYGFVANAATIWIDVLGLECYLLIAKDQVDPAREEVSPHATPGSPPIKIGNPEYDKLVETAKNVGYKVVENAGGNDVLNAMKDGKCTEIIFYTHGAPNGQIQLDGTKRGWYPAGGTFDPKHRGENKGPLKVKMVCCHWDKVCCADAVAGPASGGVNIEPIQVPQIPEGPQKGEIHRETAVKVLTKEIETVGCVTQILVEQKIAEIKNSLNQGKVGP